MSFNSLPNRIKFDIILKTNFRNLAVTVSPIYQLCAKLVLRKEIWIYYLKYIINTYTWLSTKDLEDIFIKKVREEYQQNMHIQYQTSTNKFTSRIFNIVMASISDAKNYVAKYYGLSGVISNAFYSNTIRAPSDATSYIILSRVIFNVKIREVFEELNPLYLAILAQYGKLENVTRRFKKFTKMDPFNNYIILNSLATGKPFAFTDVVRQVFYLDIDPRGNLREINFRYQQRKITIEEATQEVNDQLYEWMLYKLMFFLGHITASLSSEEYKKYQKIIFRNNQGKGTIEKVKFLISELHDDPCAMFYFACDAMDTTTNKEKFTVYNKLFLNNQKAIKITDHDIAIISKTNTEADIDVFFICLFRLLELGLYDLLMDNFKVLATISSIESFKKFLLSMLSAQFIDIRYDEQRREKIITLVLHIIKFIKSKPLVFETLNNAINVPLFVALVERDGDFINNTAMIKGHPEFVDALNRQHKR